MRQVIRAWSIFLFNILIWALLFQIIIEVKISQHLQGELELALHDAGLQIDETYLGQGYVVFNHTQAEATFRETLRRNLKQEYKVYTYIPEIEILDFYVIDHQLTGQFPYVYTYTDYGASWQVNAPTIIAIIKVEMPRTLWSQSRAVIRMSAYSYYQRDVHIIPLGV